MKILINPPLGQWDEILKRPELKNSATEEKVSEMLAALQENGWDEVCRMSKQFDGYAPEPALVSEEEMKEAAGQLPDSLKFAIAMAANNIKNFHASQAHQTNLVTQAPGITCYQKWMPIERIGLYIPGGTAPLFSTVLMLAIPAQIAGCRELVLCTPGNKEGKVHPSVLFTAAFCGITQIYRVGGVQAIASMAYGLGPVPKVDKIFGPGNSWVTMAKQLISRSGVAIDMPAGPSELLVVVDESANASFVAADLLSQAEHGPDSQVLLLTTSWELAEEVHNEVELQLTELPRKKIAEKALENSKLIVLADNVAIMKMVNQYAPEHLILATENYNELAEQVHHAGSVFLGPYSPESAGDYASGPNHTLPTSGYAKAYSGLSLDSFMKSVTFQELSAGGLQTIEPAIRLMALAEGLAGHARAANIRRDGETPAEPDNNPSPKKTDKTSKRREAEKEIMHQFLTYVNPLNLLYPLNILDPDSQINPQNLLYRLVPEEPEVPVTKTNPILYVRPNIAAMVPYSSARDEFSSSEGTFLDANENPNDTGLNRYPDPRQKELREAVAWVKGVEPTQVFLGNGSDEAIDLLIRIFCEPRMSRIITMSPTYGMYSVCAAVQDVQVDKVVLNPDFSLNTKEILDAVRFDTKMIFLCSPNNPTGIKVPLDEIQYLADRFNGILVVDEAYIDFAQGQSALNLIKECRNIVVLQTFSKAWGLAGVRLGMAFADTEIIGIMNKVKYPYNVNVLTAAKVLERIKSVREGVGAKQRNPDQDWRRGPDIELILSERMRLAEGLKGMPGVEKVYPSEANFLLVKFSDPRMTYLYLVDNGIIVRDRSTQVLCEGCLRITVGTPEENDKLFEVLKKQK